MKQQDSWVTGWVSNQELTQLLCHSEEINAKLLSFGVKLVCDSRSEWTTLPRKPQTQTCVNKTKVCFISERNNKQQQKSSEVTAGIHSWEQEEGERGIVGNNWSANISAMTHTHSYFLSAQEVSREDHGKLSSSSSAISLANSRSCCSRSRRSWTHHGHTHIM